MIYKMWAYADGASSLLIGFSGNNVFALLKKIERSGHTAELPITALFA